MGFAGAEQYIADYGQGIGVTKVVSLALCAETEGYPEMALGFWNKAFELETGARTHQHSNQIVTPQPQLTLPLQLQQT